MTKEEMRIAIAESEGWKRIPDRPNPNFRKGGTSIETLPEQWQRPNGHCEYFCPNYENLNAILLLLPCGTVLYLDSNGWQVDGPDGDFTGSNQSLALAACEFYLKWKGLWKE